MSTSHTIVDDTRPAPSRPAEPGAVPYPTAPLATHGSQRGHVAGDRAASPSSHLAARLIVLAVVQPPAISTPIGPRGMEALATLTDQRRQDAERAVRAGTATASAHGVVTTPVMRTGDPAQLITAVADEMHADAIVIDD